MKKNILQIVTIVLLILNIGLNIAVVLNYSPIETVAKKETVEDVLNRQKELDEYYKKTGKENLQIIEDSIFSSYSSKSIKGTIKNISNKPFASVQIAYKLYKNGKFVGVETGYTSFIDSGLEIPFEVNVFDLDFDEYSLFYISAYEY